MRSWIATLAFFACVARADEAPRAARLDVEIHVDGEVHGVLAWVRDPTGAGHVRQVASSKDWPQDWWNGPGRYELGLTIVREGEPPRRSEAVSISLQAGDAISGFVWASQVRQGFRPWGWLTIRRAADPALGMAVLQRPGASRWARLVVPEAGTSDGTEMNVVFERGDEFGWKEDSRGTHCKLGHAGRQDGARWSWNEKDAYCASELLRPGHYRYRVERHVIEEGQVAGESVTVDYVDEATVPFDVTGAERMPLQGAVGALLEADATTVKLQERFVSASGDAWTVVAADGSRGCFCDANTLGRQRAVIEDGYEYSLRIRPRRGKSFYLWSTPTNASGDPEDSSFFQAP